MVYRRDMVSKYENKKLQRKTCCRLTLASYVLSYNWSEVLSTCAG